MANTTDLGRQRMSDQENWQLLQGWREGESERPAQLLRLREQIKEVRETDPDRADGLEYRRRKQVGLKPRRRFKDFKQR
jgi:hypothetical protein